MRTIETTVLIVGAGPTGLALANTLAQRSVPTMIVDRAPDGANTSRAAVVHARTLDVLEPLGLAQPLIDRGVVVPGFSVRNGNRVLMRIDFRGIDSPHRYTLMLPQSTTEQILCEALPAEVRPVRELCLQTMRDSGDHLSATLVDGAGEITEVTAPWVVGADGMHSRVRELAGISFHGARYEETFALADVRMDWPISRQEVELFFAPDGLVVVAPLPDDRSTESSDRFRIVATVRDDNGPALDLAAVQQLLDARGPRAVGGAPAAAVTEILWSSRFTVHHRLAATYRSDRVFLAGDAAHVHSPAGGQGMNLGIQDAVDLGTMLADEIDGLHPDLDGYQARRRPQAERVVRLTDRMTRAATSRALPVRAARDGVISMLGHTPAVPRRLAAMLSGTAR